MLDKSNMYALCVKNLSKEYQVIHSPWKRFQYYVFNKQSGEVFSALKDINFSVKKGETFGIIGTNGSGKSTLLQIIAGIIPATSGTVTVNGKVSALLELGSGFNPESTGYENIYLNAAILGVGKKDIEKKIDEIIKFADIGSFINEPVKTYSSGMFIRLAFAVAINVDADIIIIDEALAVGDIFFRQKCYGKLNELKKDGKTIILVSHGMNEVEQFCDRALLISHGKQIMLDNSSEVVAKYYMLNQDGERKPQKEEKEEKFLPLKIDREIEFFQEKWKPIEDSFCDLSCSKEHSNGDAYYIKIGLFDSKGMARRVFKQGEYAYFYSEIMICNKVDVPINGIVIVNQKNVIVHGKSSSQTDQKLPKSVKGKTVLYNCIKIKLDIEMGEYTFESGFSSLPYDKYSHRDVIPNEELNKFSKVIADRRNVASFLIQGKQKKSPSDLKFYGLVDLKSDFDSYFL